MQTQPRTGATVTSMKMHHLLSAVAILFAGCASVHRLDNYHLYGPKFTKFSSESTSRLDAAASRKGEHAGLGAISDLAMHADDLKIDLFGNVGIATFIFRYSFKAGGNSFEKKAQGTMVFAKEGGAWKIAHEHFSTIKAEP